MILECGGRCIKAKKTPPPIPSHTKIKTKPHRDSVVTVGGVGTSLQSWLAGHPDLTFIIKAMLQNLCNPFPAEGFRQAVLKLVCLSKGLRAFKK